MLKNQDFIKKKNSSLLYVLKIHIEKSNSVVMVNIF